MNTATPIICLSYVSAAYAGAPHTLFLNQPPPSLKKITVGSTWLCFLPYTLRCKEGSIEHVRSINLQWIEFTIRWSATATADYLLVQRCHTIYSTSESLREYPTHGLLRLLGSSDIESPPKLSAHTNPMTVHTRYTIEITCQSIPTISSYPSTWTLLNTPIVLTIGQDVTLQEDSWDGDYIGPAKVVAVHALERTWVELVLRLAPNAKHFNNSSLLRMTAPLTHIALPSNISYLQARHRPNLPEILASANLPKPRKIALTALRTPQDI